MKITLPKTIQICGKTFSVSTEKVCDGGEFWLSTQQIFCKAKHTERGDEILLHEIAEAILCEYRKRYNKIGGEDNSDYLFVLTHDEFEQFIFELHGALKPFLNFRKKP